MTTDPVKSLPGKPVPAQTAAVTPPVSTSDVRFFHQSEASRDRLEVALRTEERDVGQILAEMRGEIVDSYIYSFPQGNRTITGLAYSGVKECIRRRGNVAIIPCDCCKKHYHVDDIADEFRASVKVHDLVNNVQFIGVSICKKSVPFAYVVAANKAERNAFRKLLPEQEIALLIKQWAQGAAKQPVSQSGQQTQPSRTTVAKPPQVEQSTSWRDTS